MIIRPWQSADLQDILPLYESEYGLRYSIDEWEWRYQKFQKIGIGNNWVAVIDGEAAGCNGVLPIPLVVGDQELTVGQSCDTIVNPFFRRRGIFRAIINHIFFKECGKNKMYGGMGFPLPRSYKAFLRVGAYGIGSVYRWILVLNPERLSSKLEFLGNEGFLANCLRKGGRGFVRTLSFDGRSLEIETTNMQPKLFNLLWSRMCDSEHVFVHKTIDYLTWRYITAPRPYEFLTVKRRGDLLGIIITRQIIVRGFRVQELVDIAIAHPHPINYRRVLAAFNLWSLEQQAELVRVIMHNYIPKSALWSLGYILVKHSTPLILFDHFLPSHIMRNVFYDFRRWKLVGGDWDVI